MVEVGPVTGGGGVRVVGVRVVGVLPSGEGADVGTRGAGTVVRLGGEGSVSAELFGTDALGGASSGTARAATAATAAANGRSPMTPIPPGPPSSFRGRR
ncbi:MAG: hypothetical protein M0005_10035 [Actinomycetota bacterium]|nr:hypothetical protein [Actinomycetota bacterium]